MAIKKQEFYEGAALHRLIREGAIPGFRFVTPFFVVSDLQFLYLKYSTKNRSPWGFTFTPEEQATLESTGLEHEIVLGLICGADGVAALTHHEYCAIAKPSTVAIHVACYRAHGEHYEVNGPDGQLAAKVAPSRWHRILESRERTK